MPAAQMMTFRPRSRAVPAYSETDSGFAWTSLTSTSWAMP
jgi:hypothetical protein